MNLTQRIAEIDSIVATTRNPLNREVAIKQLIRDVLEEVIPRKITAGIDSDLESHLEAAERRMVIAEIQHNIKELGL